MNDNLVPDGPNHAFALALLNDLMVVLANAHTTGMERYDEKGEPIYDFGFWANECAKAVGVRKVA